VMRRLNQRRKIICASAYSHASILSPYPSSTLFFHLLWTLFPRLACLIAKDFWTCRKGFVLPYFFFFGAYTRCRFGLAWFGFRVLGNSVPTQRHIGDRDSFCFSFVSLSAGHGRGGINDGRYTYLLRCPLLFSVYLCVHANRFSLLCSLLCSALL